MRYEFQIFLSLSSNLIELMPLILSIEHIIVKLFTRLLTVIQDLFHSIHIKEVFSNQFSYSVVTKLAHVMLSSKLDLFFCTIDFAFILSLIFKKLL